MKKKFIFLIIIVFFVLIFYQAMSAAAGTSANTKFIEGLEKTGGEGGAGYPVAKIEASPGSFLAKILGSTLTPMFIGVTGLLIFFYGGWTLMMARGNEEKVEKAKTILANTAIAMIVAFSSYAILKLILPLWEFVTKTSA